MKLLFTLFAVFLAVSVNAQVTEAGDSSKVGVANVKKLPELTVSAHSAGHVRGNGIGNTEIITSSELLRAACCNLGESFTTNPSVDVNYSDAATGAQQIKLLGLSGTYVQMLTENIPNYRGVSAPYSLSFIPGPWMQSIQVSKGASSVKNGYESVTGQINVEIKKPQATPFADANMYYNSKGKLEANLGGNIQLSKRWSTAVLGHFEMLDKAHDSNGDGFADMPKIRQGAIQSRWAWMGDNYVFQASVKGLKERRESGQTSHHTSGTHMPYLIDITNERYEAFTKNALFINKEHATNVALIISGSLHHNNAIYGHKALHIDQRNAYASLMYETDFDEHHSLSAGLSINHDHFDQEGYWQQNQTGMNEGSGETTPGVYAQYTFKIAEMFVAMGGIRCDHSSIYGTFVTPRMHLKYTPNSLLTLRASIGKGYRTAHPLAENNYLLASGRQVTVDNGLKQEEAINCGLSTALNIPIGEKKLKIDAEYYYTNFIQQTVIDFDTDPHAVLFTNLNGDSYSHTWQVEASYPILQDITLTAAYRRTDVKCTYNGVLRDKPLTNKYKALLTASWQPMLGKWQIDMTTQFNGGGRMPTPYVAENGDYSWNNNFKLYEQIGIQVTRFFRHWSVYAGGENITNFKQKDPIIGADDPWGKNFDSTMIWGPVHGAIYYIGARLNWNKM